MRHWILPLARKLRALQALTPTRRTKADPRPPRLALTELERRDLLTAAYVLQDAPDVENSTPSYLCVCLMGTPPTNGLDVDVEWETVDGTARAGADFTASSGTAVITEADYCPPSSKSVRLKG